MGIPVICNDIGDTGKIIKETAAGVLISKFEIKEYDTVSRHVLSMKAADKEQIRQSACKYFDLKAGAARYKGIYEKLLL